MLKSKFIKIADSFALSQLGELRKMKVTPTSCWGAVFGKILISFTGKKNKGGGYGNLENFKS